MWQFLKGKQKYNQTIWFLHIFARKIKTYMYKNVHKGGFQDGS
jgi:hypothetical protein